MRLSFSECFLVIQSKCFTLESYWPSCIHKSYYYLFKIMAQVIFWQKGILFLKIIFQHQHMMLNQTLALANICTLRLTKALLIFPLARNSLDQSPLQVISGHCMDLLLELNKTIPKLLSSEKIILCIWTYAHCQVQSNEKNPQITTLPSLCFNVGMVLFLWLFFFLLDKLLEFHSSSNGMLSNYCTFFMKISSDLSLSVLQ